MRPCLPSVIGMTTAVLACFFSAQSCSAEIVDLTIDANASNISLSINNSASQTSAMSGTSVIDVLSSNSPFGIAQITQLDLVLDDGLTFDLGLFVTASTTPGDVTLTMLTPGAPATVVGGLFDQLNNEIALDGDIAVTDPLNIFGGDQIFDLSTLGSSFIDLVGVQISRSGNTLTVSGTFAISDSIDVGGGVLIPIVATGTFSANGIVGVPEPGTAFGLAIASALLVCRRRKTQSGM